MKLYSDLIGNSVNIPKLFQGCTWWGNSHQHNTQFEMSKWFTDHFKIHTHQGVVHTEQSLLGADGRQYRMVLQQCCWYRLIELLIKLMLVVSTLVQPYQTATGIVVEMTNGKWDNVGIGTRQTGPLPSVERSAFVQLTIQSERHFFTSLVCDCSVLWKGGNIPAWDV